MNKMMQKLRSRAGESISEVLIAMLVSALGLAMLAGVITTSTRIITKSRETVKTYTQAENALESHDADSLEAKSGTVVFAYGDGSDRFDSVNYSVNYGSKTIGAKNVTVYWKD